MEIFMRFFIKSLQRFRWVDRAATSFPISIGLFVLLDQIELEYVEVVPMALCG